MKGQNSFYIDDSSIMLFRFIKSRFMRVEVVQLGGRDGEGKKWYRMGGGMVMGRNITDGRERWRGVEIVQIGGRSGDGRSSTDGREGW